MKIAKLTAGIFLGVLTAYACGGKSTQAGGSNTNWFATCDASSECGSGLTCWCGICTKTCADECNASAGATCSAPPPSCTDPAEAAKEKACAVQCTKDADCKDVGADATCVDSICRRPAAKSPGASTCDQINSETQNALQPLRDAADESCQRDLDCVPFPDLSCDNGCPGFTISRKGLAAIRGQIDAIDKNVCPPSAQGVCFVHSCPYTGAPGCVHGKCQNVFPGSQQADAGTCDTQANQINNTLLDKLDALDKSCNVDADCTRVQPELSCEYGCPVDVSTTAAAAFAATRSGLESDLCASFNAQGCTPPPDGCPDAPGEPKCVEGVCIDDFTMTTDRFAGMSCDQRTAQMTTELQGTVGVADTQCTKDADCQSVMLVNNCMESCTYAPASTSGAQEIRAELATLELEYCPWFTKAGCTVQRLPCVGPPMLKCNAGVCSAQ